MWSVRRVKAERQPSLLFLSPPPPPGQGDASNRPDPGQEVNELIASRQHAVSAGLAGVRDNRALEQMAFYFWAFPFSSSSWRPPGERWRKLGGGLNHPRGKSSHRRVTQYRTTGQGLCIDTRSETCPLFTRTGHSGRHEQTGAPPSAAVTPPPSPGRDPHGDPRLPRRAKCLLVSDEGTEEGSWGCTPKACFPPLPTCP